MIVNNISTDKETGNGILLARWSERFLAWLIDFIIVTIGIMIISVIISLFVQLSSVGNSEKLSDQIPIVLLSFYFPVSIIIFFLYWFLLESISGQSIGKRALGIKITNLQGKIAKRKDVAIESFGKSLFLPLDVILGLIFTNEKRQRLFNRISETIVIKVKPRGSQVDIADSVRYIKD